MGISGVNDDLLEKSKEALQSEIWQIAGKRLKTEIMHFTEEPGLAPLAEVKMSKNDNVYGVTWAGVVREYLKTSYSGECAGAEVVSGGITYKVLKRRAVTAFYDEDGNTLFDVENKRLEREYEWLMKKEKQADTEEKIPDRPVSDTDKLGEGREADQEATVALTETPQDKAVTGMPIENGVPETGISVKQKAKEKLEKEMKDDKDKSFAEPIIGYLLERCAEDEGLSQDVVQEHKTWKKCLDYIYEMARKQATGNRAAVRSDVVFEWSEDYYHKDDKAEEEEKKRKEAERKAKQKKAKAERKARVKDKPAKTASSDKKKEDTPKEQPKPKKSGKDMEGQLDMFSMMWM